MISSYSDLCKFVRKVGADYPFYPESCILSQESLRRLAKLAQNSIAIRDLISHKSSSRVVLLSEVVGNNPYEFSTRDVFKLPTKEEVEKRGRVKDMYRCFKSYVSAFNVVFTFDAGNPNGLYTQVNYMNKKDVPDFLVQDFPIGRLEPIDGVTLGRIEDMAIDLEDYESKGVDYLFDVETGEYITPLHVDLTLLELRLKAITKSQRMEGMRIVRKGEGEKEDKSVEREVLADNMIGANLANLPTGDPVAKEQKAIEEEKEQQKQKGKKRKKKDEEPAEGRLKNIPYMVFLGKDFESPVFGFGRIFTMRLAGNVLYSSNDYGLNGQATIYSMFQASEKRIKENYKNLPLNRGVVYSTERFVENYDKGLSYEERFSPPSKFIPSVKHFNGDKKSATLGGKTLREMRMEDIVKIFPPDELQILKLAIGRAVIGPSGSKEYMNPDFVVFSDWRKAIVTVGPPKIGKSTVLEGIIEAMEYCGFSACTGIDFSSRFNVGQSVLSNISVFDDLTQERLTKNLTSNEFKTSVTNGRLSVEDKGKDKEQVRSITTIIGNTNDFTKEALYDVDSGAKNRFVTLSAHRALNDENPWVMTEKVAYELDIPKVGIWIRILRECLDEALRYCSINGEKPLAGITINDKVDNLALDNVNYFDSEPGVTFVVLMLTLRLLRLDNVEEKINTIPSDIRDSPEFYDCVIDAHTLLSDNLLRNRITNVLQRLWDSCKNRVPYHPKLGLRELRYKSLNMAIKEVNHAIANSSYEPDNLNEDAIQTIMSCIKNNNGFIRKSYRGIAKDWKTVLDSTYIKEYIIEIVYLMKGYLNKNADESEETTDNGSKD